MCRRRNLLLLTACLGLLLLAVVGGRATWRSGDVVPFTVVEKGFVLRKVSPTSTAELVVLTDVRAVALFEQRILASVEQDSAVDRLLGSVRHVPYETTSALVIFGGDEHDDKNFQLDEIRRNHDHLYLYSSFPPEEHWYDWIYGGRVRSSFGQTPYQVISIPKIAGTPITFTLIANDKFVDQEHVVMP